MVPNKYSSLVRIRNAAARVQLVTGRAWRGAPVEASQCLYFSPTSPKRASTLWWLSFGGLPSEHVLARKWTGLGLPSALDHQFHRVQQLAAPLAVKFTGILPGEPTAEVKEPDFIVVYQEAKVPQLDAEVVRFHVPVVKIILISNENGIFTTLR